MNAAVPPTPISPLFPFPPSPGPEGDASMVHVAPDAAVPERDDLFADSTQPITSRRDPGMVPLPPSPQKPRLSNRRPADWVSALSSNRSTSDHTSNDLGGRQSSATPRRGVRSVSARLPSGPSPLVVQGRTISGAMQHAMRPASPEAQEAQSTDDNAPATLSMTLVRTEQGNEMNASSQPHTPVAHDIQGEDVDTPNDDEDDEDGIIEFGMDEIRNSVLGITDQQDDEIWMQYVRDQLSTLFPDFLDPTRQSPSALDRGLGDEEQGREVVLDGAHRRPMSMDTRARALEVPNVRDEIGGLREEIERLRGVVGGLAEGLYRGGVVDVEGTAEGRGHMEGNDVDHTGNEFYPAAGEDAHPTADVEDHAGRKENGEVSSLPAGFHDNAAAIADLIRAVSGMVYQSDGSMQPDEEIFTLSYIQHLGEVIQSALEGLKSQ